MGCIDSQLRPVLPPPDGGALEANPSLDSNPNDRSDSSSILPSNPALYAVTGSLARVCVAGENVVACKPTGDTSTWQPLTLDPNVTPSLRGVALGVDGRVVAVGEHRGVGIVLSGTEQLMPLSIGESGPLHDVASVGEVFVTVGDVSPTGLVSSSWQIRGERVSAWPSINGIGAALGAVWSDGLRVVAAGTGLWIGNIEKVSTAWPRDDLFVDVVGLADGSVLALGQKQLVWWQNPDQWQEIPLPDQDWQALALNTTANQPPMLYLLSATGLYQLDPTLSSQQVPSAITIEGLFPAPSQLRDLWFSGSRAVLVGLDVLASCELLQAASGMPTLRCRQESLASVQPPPPPPPEPCVEVDALAPDACLSFEELQQSASLLCAREQRSLAGLLPREPCMQPTLTWRAALGFCCEPNTKICQQTDSSALPAQECQALPFWLQWGQELCQQEGQTLRGLVPATGCDEGTFSLRGATCCP